MADLDENGDYVFEPIGAPASPAPAEDSGDYQVVPGSIEKVQLAPGVPSTSWVGRPLRAPVESSQYGAEYLKIKNKNMAGTAGLLESLVPDSSDVPFIGDVLGGIDSVGVLEVAKKMKNGEDVSDDELLKFNTYLEQTNRDRDRSWAGDLAVGARKLVSFGTEFAAWTALMATGVGAVPAGSGAALSAEKKLAAIAADQTLKGITKSMAVSAIKKEAMHDALKDATKGAIKGVLGDRWGAEVLSKVGGGLAASSAEGAGILAVDRSLEKLTSMALGQDEVVTRSGLDQQLSRLSEGKDTDGAFWDRLGSDFFEYQSEMMGPYLERTGSALAKATGVAKHIDNIGMWGRAYGEKFRAMIAKKMAPMGTAAVDSAIATAGFGATVAHLATKMPFDGETIAYFAQMAGHNGILGEMAEERYGGFMQGLFGFQGDGPGLKNAWDQMIPPMNQLGQEAALFALPTLLGLGTHAALMSETLGGQGYPLTKLLRSMEQLQKVPKAKESEAPVLFNQTRDGILQQMAEENAKSDTPLSQVDLEKKADAEYLKQKADFEEAAGKRAVYESSGERDRLVKNAVDQVMFQADNYVAEPANRFIRFVRRVVAPLQSLAGFDFREAEYGKGGVGADRLMAAHGFQGELVKNAAQIKEVYRKLNPEVPGKYTLEQQEKDADDLARNILSGSLSRARSEQILALDTPEQVAEAKKAGAVTQVVGMRDGMPYRMLVSNPQAEISADIRKQMDKQGITPNAPSFDAMRAGVNATSYSGDDFDAMVNGYFSGARSPALLASLYDKTGINAADVKHIELLDSTMKVFRNVQKMLGGSFGEYSRKTPGNVLKFTDNNMQFAATWEDLQKNPELHHLAYNISKEDFDRRAAAHKAMYGEAFPGLKTGAPSILIRTGATRGWDHGDGTKGILLSLRTVRGVAGEKPGGLTSAYSLLEDLNEVAMPLDHFLDNSKSAAMEFLRKLADPADTYLDNRVDEEAKTASSSQETLDAHKVIFKMDADEVRKIIETNDPVMRRELFGKLFLHQVKEWAPSKFRNSDLWNALAMTRETSIIGNVAKIDSARWAPAERYIAEQLGKEYGVTDLKLFDAPFNAYWESVAQAEANAKKAEEKKAAKKAGQKKARADILVDEEDNLPGMGTESKEKSGGKQEPRTPKPPEKPNLRPAADAFDLREAQGNDEFTNKVMAVMYNKERYTAFSNKRDFSDADKASFRTAITDVIGLLRSVKPEFRSKIDEASIRDIMDKHKVYQNKDIQKKVLPLFVQEFVGQKKPIEFKNVPAESAKKIEFKDVSAAPAPERTLAQEASKALVDAKRSEAASADKWAAEQKARIDAERAAATPTLDRSALANQVPGGLRLDVKGKLLPRPVRWLGFNGHMDNGKVEYIKNDGQKSVWVISYNDLVQANPWLKEQLAKREAVPAPSAAPAPVAPPSRAELEKLPNQDLLKLAPEKITGVPTLMPLESSYDADLKRQVPAVPTFDATPAEAEKTLKMAEDRVTMFENVLRCMGAKV